MSVLCFNMWLSACEPNPLSPLVFSGVYLDACVEPCVKNIPTVNYECVCAPHVHACVLCNSKLWMCRAAAGAMGPVRASKHVAHRANVQMMDKRRQMSIKLKSVSSLFCFSFLVQHMWRGLLFIQACCAVFHIFYLNLELKEVVQKRPICFIINPSMSPSKKALVSAC